ncbi:type II toxin-antitoxin system RelE/ParE family toxin [Sandaracinobacteroides saxicola]|uniref:Toxin n=1 Tax=Sandaracinobacteroides saxicola TaxID=2759707 RepID=A0A7G5IGV7_9SPHN|nr:type II toxin-antitoxin system RelE/ParE family toxin [Sandaracinobacteroides saxicola]QMW22599.1 type II toxin-antitoxin system RelE/ParE family toxin [Sandaracinobacteroides saxicola]
MSSALYSNRAVDDLRTIETYTATQWGDAQADRYVRAIMTAVDRLAENPALGRAVAVNFGQYRRISSGSHVIYVVVQDGQTTVVRILHQRMEPGLHL